ncbi:MAG: L-rhamnose mutarotase [Verrucomicrobia bacterium]|nr:L-rhamnose mutarotase [Verrucomicrobiota bacterium]
MIRKAFVMSLYPGTAAEYERRHAPIARDLADTLDAHGVRNYSIFLQAATGQLFAYAEIESEERWNTIAETPACRHWWNYMRDLMPVERDGRPCAVDLREVFHLPDPSP